MDLTALLSDLEGASPEQAEEVLRQVMPAYLERRRQDPLEFFRYSSDGQRRFCSSTAPGRIALAGNRAGKSEPAAAEGCRFAQGKHPHRRVPVNAKGWVGCPSSQVQKDVHQKKILKYLPEKRIADVVLAQGGGGVFDSIYLRCNRCDSKPTQKKSEGRKGVYLRWLCPTCREDVPFIGFRSYEQELNKWQAEGLDWIWFDEEPPELHFKEGIARLLGRPFAAWWLTYTPVLGLRWILEKLIEKKSPRREIVRWSTFDNKALAASELKQMEEDYPDDADRRLRFYGEYVIQEGLVYKEWDASKNEVDALPAEFFTEKGLLRPDLAVWRGIDTGRNFAAIYVLSDYDANLWVFDEVFDVDKDIHDLADRMRTVDARWGIQRHNDRLDPASQHERELAREGIYCGKPDVSDKQATINAVKAYIRGAQHPEEKKPGLKVVRKNCPNLLRERAFYRWAPPKATGPEAGVIRDEPLKINDHCMDGLRFVACEHPSPSIRSSKPWDQLSPVEQHKERVRKALQEKREEREAQADEFDIDPYSGE